MLDNNELLLVSDDFKLKSYTNSLSNEFSYIELHVHLNQISNSEPKMLPIYIAYFYKAIVLKYSITCKEYDFNIFKLEVADAFITIIQKMFSDYHFKPGKPINTSFTNLPKSLQVSEEFTHLIIEEFTDHYANYSYANPDNILQTLLFFKSISNTEQSKSIDNRMFSLISDFKNNFYLENNCSIEEIENLMLKSYEEFINSKLFI